MSQFADVMIEEWGVKGTVYKGTQDALIATGLFRLEWFPGQQGNGSTSATFIFTDAERNGYIANPGKGLKRSEYGFGRVNICRCNSLLFRAFIKHSPVEKARRRQANAAQSYAEDWQRAKQVRADKKDVLRRWKDAVGFEIGNFEKLCTGQSYFTDMPDVRIQGRDLERVKEAVETLRAAFMQSTPMIPDVVVRSNVFSIRDGIHRGLKKRA